MGLASRFDWPELRLWSGNVTLAGRDRRSRTLYTIGFDRSQGRPLGPGTLHG